MGKAVVVTGATRGLGRGIARGFAQPENTVVITGRDEIALADACSEIEQRGAKAIPIRCDHSDDAQVEQAFAAISEKLDGKIDVLVNNAAAVYPQDLLMPGGFWEKPLRLADMINVGLRSSYTATYFAVPLMIKRSKGLIVNVSFYGARSYFHGPAYGAAKAGTDKMTADMAVDLAGTGVTVVSFWPGFILTDAVRATPPDMIPEEFRQRLRLWETPEFSAVVLNALAEDAALPAFNGQVVIGAELGVRYGIKDSDGKQPISYRSTMGEPLVFMGAPAPR